MSRVRVVPWLCLLLSISGCGSSAPSPAQGAALGGTPGASGAGANPGQAGVASGGAGSAVSGAGSGGTSLGGSSAGAAGSAGEIGGGAPTDPLFPKLLDDCDAEAAHQRADAALAAMLTGFWSGADQWLHAASPSTGSLTGYWTYAQGFDALLDGVQRTGGQRYRGLVRSFYDGRDARGWLVDYFDDETWMTLALIRAFELTGEPRYLDTAREIYEDIMKAWDTSCCGEHLGGIWWNRQHQQKATASNGGPVIAGVRLTRLTADPQYLAFAKQAYAFWWEHMVNQQTFAIYDHLSPNGTRATGSLTYNHGVMIGAALELHAATKEAHFLEEAHGFARYLSTVATRPSDVGPLLHDALGQTCDNDCPAWKGIGYRYLVDAFRADQTQAQYRDVLVAGPQALWTLARNADTNFFSTNWAGPAPAAGGIEEQGSAVMALNLHAILCGSVATTGALPGRYEAEEATIDHVGLEAQYAGFSGFGYVAAFSKTGQSLTFDVDVEAAGTYTATFTYAAGSGEAKRALAIDGAIASASQVFPATAGWEQWSTQAVTLTLPAGKSQLTVSYENGSAAALNLDKLELAKP
jgi:predicted alpha-1,6-mannanase (GH76 family)